MTSSIYNNLVTTISGFKIFLRINVIGLLILIFHSCGLGDCALRGVQLIVEPPTVRRGHHATFRCLYDMNGAELYSVKFYRGLLEFYRFTPNERPSTKVFPFPGFNVDVSMSNATQVVLRNVGFPLSGNFSCEVTADAPYFSTATAFVRLLVVETPDKKPEIWTEQHHYEVGEILRANCSTAPSRPRAVLKFSINNIALQPTSTENIDTIDQLFVTKISIKLRLQGIHFISNNHIGNSYSSSNFGGNFLNFINPSNNNGNNNGVGSLILRCSSKIDDFYQDFSEIELGGVQKDPIPARVTSSSASIPKSFLWQLEKYLTNLLPSTIKKGKTSEIPVSRLSSLSVSLSKSTSYENQLNSSFLSTSSPTSLLSSSSSSFTTIYQSTTAESKSKFNVVKGGVIPKLTTFTFTVISFSSTVIGSLNLIQKSLR
ncbi:uncharacterized protein LOC129611536 [Condylostylus longicornis]|uniref:uncharacterized protein LOC129611536 n=1 Tax=Condylostylus longicornis TaxID=2530218 RepID=UPI00244E3244|nr:uncharacterized protein LOC129611536 [Condylostylus longicornis]